MDDLEREWWVKVVEGLIRGGYVELLYRDQRMARHEFDTCVGILREIDLPFDAKGRQDDLRVSVCGTVRFRAITNPKMTRGCYCGWE